MGVRIDSFYSEGPRKEEFTTIGMDRSEFETEMDSSCSGEMLKARDFFDEKVMNGLINKQD
jgi:hypothetical protein